MSSIVVAGDTSGTVTLSAPAVAGSSVLTLPVATDTLVGKATTDTLTNKTLGSGLVAGASFLTSGTAVASTSGTSIDFTGIPSWAKRVTVMFNGVSTNGTSAIIFQLGSGTIDATGYISTSTRCGPTTLSTASYTTGFGINVVGADRTYSGSISINNLNSNIWTAAGLFAFNTASESYNSSGVKTLSGTLDRLRLTTVNGTDLFDAGSINIMYE